MGKLMDFPFQDGYSTSSQSLLKDFYEPALEQSTSYWRAAGYFASSLFALAPLAYADFVARGGKMRLLCSPHLTELDAEFFTSLSSETQSELPRDVVAKSLRVLQESGRAESALVEALSNLVDSGILEIRFVIYRGGNLFHDKVGIFGDESGAVVSFLGSANETRAAWSGENNHEQIEVFCSWHSQESQRRSERHLALFEETWAGLRRGLKIIPSAESAEYIHRVVPPDDLNASLARVRDASQVADSSLEPPKRPLRSYQNDVLAEWERKGKRGIVSFATGGGKTLTAINAIREWVGEGSPALVLVPSELLHLQWESEIRQELGDIAILRVGAGANRKNWLENLRGYSSNDVEAGPRIILSTYQSASTEAFLSRIYSGEHLLLVGDEVHRIGAPDTRSLMGRIDAGGRLGLSATPERFGDEEGTAAILEYFGDVLEPRFTLEDAISQKVLVEYDYHLEVCQLTEEEQADWDFLSKQIAKDYAKNQGELSDYGRHLIRRRAVVGKRASGKAAIAKRILSTKVSPEDRWLVYCNDHRHLKEVGNAISELGLRVMEYHSENSESHRAILDHFVSRGGVLLAIKCLDEGIDIPVINKALILASSTNPREYIQRRGRVLRKSPGKFSAQIFDVAVVDIDGLPLTPSEVIRADEFAKGARNVASGLEIEVLKTRVSVRANSLKDRTDFEDDVDYSETIER